MYASKQYKKCAKGTMPQMHIAGAFVHARFVRRRSESAVRMQKMLTLFDFVLKILNIKSYLFY